MVAPDAADHEGRAATAAAVQQTVIERLAPPSLAPRADAESTKTDTDLAPGSIEQQHASALVPLDPQPEPAPTLVVVRPQVTPAPRAGPEAWSAPEAVGKQEPAPTIQVTIGRIEIRATPPPASTPKRERSKPPVMSLDEYLRQRNQGGQR
jgi:hypothetical protein